MKCFYCNHTFIAPELRPYGPKGESICFDCAMQPEHVGNTEQMYQKTLDACGPNITLTDIGPRPMTADDLQAKEHH